MHRVRVGNTEGSRLQTCSPKRNWWQKGNPWLTEQLLGDQPKSGLLHRPCMPRDVGGHAVQSLGASWKLIQAVQNIVRARDPKECIARILKGKGERTQNHQWLQDSRTRAALVVKARCSVKVVSGSCQVRFWNFPWGRVLQKIVRQILWEAAVQDPCAKPSVKGIFKEIATKDLFKGSQRKISVKLSKSYLWARSLLSLTSLCTRSLEEVSSKILYKISKIKRALLARSL